MHVHIFGVCGTFMGGVAALAKAAGHRVTGSDKNVYPPMSTQLEALGIEVIEGDDPSQLGAAGGHAPDMVVVGNVMSRGYPLVEALLNSGLPYTSGPQWLAENVLRGRWVLAVAGTHGKTTTSSLLAWILEYAGFKPGFLIGGVAANFGATARLGESPFFVIEADEYDTAFFDKRSKFVHFRPRTAVLNNLEYDHADIFPDVEAIERQFHQLVRTVPGDGLIVSNSRDGHLRRVLEMGCWTPVVGFAAGGTSEAGPAAGGAIGRGGTLSATSAAGAPNWTIGAAPAADFSSFEVLESGVSHGRVRWPLIGTHNAQNALAAIAAARHAGVHVATSIEALGKFAGVKRRLELRGTVNGIAVYDDFAHHPTAIALTLDGLRQRVGAARIVAVLEPRSNTMKLGVHRETLAASLAGADEVWLYAPPDLGWDVQGIVAPLGTRAHLSGDIDDLTRRLSERLRTGDHVLIMSNGGFGGLHGRLLEALQKRQ